MEKRVTPEDIKKIYISIITMELKDTWLETAENQGLE